MDSNNWFWISLNILGGAAFDFFKFKHSLASYKPVHAVVASVLVSTLSTTSLAALSSFLSSRSTCSTIFPWASMPTYRDKEIEFRIAKKYYCWKENKSRWKNQYSSWWRKKKGGCVALFQFPTKLVVEQFWQFLAIAWAFLSRFIGSFGIFHCTCARNPFLHLWHD